MFEIRSIRPSSLAKLVALINLVLYLLVGVLFTVVFGFVRNLIEGFTNGLSSTSFFLVWLGGCVVVLAFSWLVGFLIGLIYNVVARWWGGLRVDLGRIEVVQRAERNETSNRSKHSNPS